MKKVIPKILGSIIMYSAFMGGLSIVKESTVDVCISPMFFLLFSICFGVGVCVFNLEG